MSYKQIADLLGISERTVYRITSASKQDGVVFFSEGRGWSTEETEKYGSQGITCGFVSTRNGLVVW